jgi:hypothetical protein
VAGQSLRPSQFLTTYGPGAILETRDGPCVIRSLEGTRDGLFRETRSGKTLVDYQIDDPRLSQVLGGKLILRLPSNAEHGITDDTPLYRTDPFPLWSLCVTHGILYRYTAPRGCPRCSTPRSDVQKKAGREAIRFVLACDLGHLDDFDWVGAIVHQGSAPCQPAWLHWQGGGGALRNIRIVCPDCGEGFNLGEAYSRPWLCTGRLPEQNRHVASHFGARMLQRGAANLRFPELQTALTIPPFSTEIIRALRRPLVANLLDRQPTVTAQQLRAQIAVLAIADPANVSLQRTIDQYTDAQIDAAIADLRAALRRPQTLRAQEFTALRHAAAHGAPALRSSTPDSPDQFEVIRPAVQSFPMPGGHVLRVTPVSRLRVVLVQTGYRRVDLDNGALVEVVLRDQNQEWLPGVELFGEGVYLDLAPDAPDDPWHFELTGPEADAWAALRRDPSAYGRSLEPEEHDQLNPVFIWWHTLAHRLINALSIDSGYSSAAIRERVFIETDAAGLRARGGVLLYTAQPGGDGTLGGLIAMVPAFDRIIGSALRDVDACSNDSLCQEQAIGPGGLNGAACYACQLVSETSCEHRNSLLDRNLLRANRP